MGKFGKLYRKVTTHLDDLGVWVAGIVILFGGFTLAAKASIFLVRFGWPIAVFFGASATVIVMLAAAMLLAAWRFFRPLSINPAIDAAMDKVDDTQRSLNQLHDFYCDLLDQIGDIKVEYETHYSLAKDQLGDFEAATSAVNFKLTEAIKSIGSIQPAVALQNICNEMDKIADETYGGSNSPVTQPNFLANEYTTKRFQILSRVAGDVIVGAGIDLRVPSDAGICWWIPPSPGMDPLPGPEYTCNEKLRTAMMMRCDHYQIKEYLNSGTTASKLMGG